MALTAATKRLKSLYWINVDFATVSRTPRTSITAMVRYLGHVQIARHLVGQPKANASTTSLIHGITVARLLLSLGNEL